MSTFFLFIYKLCKRNRIIAIILLSTLILVSAFYASKLKFSEDISKVLPDSENIENMSFVLHNSKILDKLVFKISMIDSTQATDDNHLLKNARIVFNFLNDFVPDQMESVEKAPDQHMMQGVYSFLNSNLPLFLDEEDYLSIDTIISEQGLINNIDANYKLLSSPAGFATRKTIQQDPLHLTNFALERLKSFNISDGFIVQDEFIVSKDWRNIIILTSPASNSNSASNKIMFQKIDSLANHLALNQNIKLNYFGNAAIVLGNAERIKKDIILTVSIAFIVLLVFISLFFRKKRSFILIFTPAIFGGLISLAFLSLFINEVSAIALGIGSVLLGISVDYAIHILSHYRQNADIKSLFRDVSTPIIVSSLTTASAFLSLLFINSKALNDLGLFAAVSVLAAAFFSILVLPHLLKGSSSPIRDKKSILDKVAQYNFHKNKTLKYLLIIITIVFWYTSNDVTFNADMSENNYMDTQLIEAEKAINEISTVSNKSIYIVSVGQQMEEAHTNNEETLRVIDSLASRKIINSFTSVNSLIKPAKKQTQLIDYWDNYWNENKEKTLLKFDQIAAEKGFKANAFKSLYNTLNKEYRSIGINTDNDLFNSLLSNYLIETDTLSAVINVLKLDNKDDNIEQVYAAFQNRENVWIVDKRLMTSEFMGILNDNFSKLVYISLFFVFIILLIAYGRIELTVLTMIPVIISWVWTVGIMGLFGISFNIFNIIILSFIFGLGIDYSIFIMRGLLQEYKYGIKDLPTYKLSILLSFITTIVGIGVLIFAQHPALKSIALMSVIGIFSVVIVNFILLPSLFHWLVSYKKGLRNRPITLLDFMFSIGSLIVFVGGALIMTLLSFVFKIIPANPDRKKLFFHYLFNKLTWFLIYMNFLSPKRILNPDGEDYSESSIIIANHQSHIDLMLMMLLNPRVLILTNRRNYTHPFYGKALQYADFIPSDEGYEKVLEDIKPLIKKGYSLVIYPEGHRNDSGRIKRFHKGAFYLAEKLGIPIQPIIIHGQNQLLKKSELFLKRGSITTKFLPKIHLDGDSHGDNLKDKTKYVQEYFRTEYNLVREEFETPKYFADYIRKNYLYKGPVLEWYTLIKLKLEDNYNIFNSLIPRECKITDLGCGYGYLDFMLNLVSENRIINAVDYDHQKLAVANNCAIKNRDVNFFAADIMEYKLEESDVFILKDVLHYLPKEQQFTILERCLSKLTASGFILVRDGDTSEQKQHKFTKLTEFFSTSFGFNKTMHKLEFINENDLQDFAKSFDLKLEVLSKAKGTSNKLYVLRK